MASGTSPAPWSCKPRGNTELDHYWSKQNEGSAAADLKHTIENIFADMHVMNSFYFCFFFHRRLFFALGARENGLGARPNFLYAGKTLIYI